MPFRLGPTELIIILVIVLVVFGAGKLSQIGGALGKGIKEFRKSSSSEDEDAEMKKPSKENAAKVKA